MEGAHDKGVENDITHEKDELKEDTIELAVNQIYDKMTKLFNDTRKRYGGDNIKDPIKNYKNFNLGDNCNLTIKYKYRGRVISFGNISEGLFSPSKIRKFGVGRLEFIGFNDITYKDVEPSKYKDTAAFKVRKSDDDLNERSRAIKSSSTRGQEQ